MSFSISLHLDITNATISMILELVMSNDFGNICLIELHSPTYFDKVAYL